jgi:hypothetical protein
MNLVASIDEMLARAALPAWRERTAAMRAAFEKRTGVARPQSDREGLAPSERWEGLEGGFFEARSAAFWDDALTRSAFGRALASEITEEARGAVEPLACAHRGIFRVEASDAAGAFILVDEWSGAEFAAHPTTAGLRDALACAASLVDGRVVGLRDGARIELLAGAVFHAADALEPMRALLPEARARGLETHDLCDALLRMDHALRSLSRVKAAFAYRKEALPAQKI